MRSFRAKESLRGCKPLPVYGEQTLCLTMKYPHPGRLIYIDVGWAEGLLALISAILSSTSAFSFS
jgi:hypothetical protein